jgi:hypothetical protein
MSEFDPNMVADFNAEEEYKATPLVPSGSYNAAVTNVTFEPEQKAIVWQFTLKDNGGVCSDGDTPVDGAVMDYKNWLPVPGDENTMTKNGRNTKRQSKINMIAEFSKAMGIDMNSPHAIMSAMESREWIGLETRILVGVREYEGKFYNEIKRVGV